jgi:hypothetical protein
MAWIGVDLDGTLAEYHGYCGPEHIGDPVPLMLARVKTWLSEGKDVRIFTARADDSVSEKHIRHWCSVHVGQVLPITRTKDYGMIELWDDRAVQVIPNTGQRADGVI